VKVVQGRGEMGGTFQQIRLHTVGKKLKTRRPKYGTKEHKGGGRGVCQPGVVKQRLRGRKKHCLIMQKRTKRGAGTGSKGGGSMKIEEKCLKNRVTKNSAGNS